MAQLREFWKVPKMISELHKEGFKSQLKDNLARQVRTTF